MEKPANTNPATAAARSPATAAAKSPTTYVQANAHNFRELVQRLTGAAPGDLPAPVPTRTSPVTVAPRRQAFKLQERRGPSVRKLEIHLGVSSPPPHLHHHHHGGGSSNSPIPSPVTPLGWDPLSSPVPASEEERAIVEKGFYIHPSPRGRGQGSDPPELLPLFPVCSPTQQQEQPSPMRSERNS